MVHSGVGAAALVADRIPHLRRIENWKLPGCSQVDEGDIQTRMDFHSLSEELPMGRERIREMAWKTPVIRQKLAVARKELAAPGG